jgi:fibronectin-binding autotransporter adhesin
VQAVAADYYWDVNGTTAYGDEPGIFRSSVSGTTWSTSASGTSPLTFVIASGVGTTSSSQFGFGSGTANNTNSRAVTIGNSTSTANQPTVGALIFNASGTSGYTITNSAGNANLMSVTLTGSATNAIGSGTGILVNSNVSGDTTFGKFGSGTGGTGSNVSNVGSAGIILCRAQAWTNNSTSYSLIVNAPIAGAFALTTNGAGTIVLGGTNSFNSLNVSSGKATLNGSIAGTIATLTGGTGRIGGDLNLQAGAMFSFVPGKTLAVTGSATFGGFSVADIQGLSSSAPDGTYTLMSGLINFANVSNVGVGNAVSLGGNKSASLQQGSLQLVVVPEPSVFIVRIAGLWAAVAAIRRRTD